MNTFKHIMDTLEQLNDDVKDELIKLMEEGLQFVEKPKEILCSNCSDIPLFHYMYPCLHPYCRDCYVMYQRRNKKCKVCQTEIGTKMLQSKKVEAAVYKLKTVCPNKPFGCNDEIELNILLEHLVKCKYSKQKQLPKLYKDEADTSAEDSTDPNYLKLFIENMKKTINDLLMTVEDSTKREKQLCQENERLKDEILKITVEVTKLIAAVKSLTYSNDGIRRKMKEMKEELKQNENESKESTSMISEDFELVNQKIQLLYNIVTDIEPNIEKKVANDFMDLKNIMDESKQLLETVKENHRSILIQNDQFVKKNQRTIDESKKIAEENRKLSYNNSESLSLIKILFEDNKNKAEVNVKVINDYKQLKIDCENLIEIRSSEVNKQIKSLEENWKAEFQTHKENLEGREKPTFNNPKLFEENLEKKEDAMYAKAAKKAPENGVLIWKINEFSKWKEIASTSASGRFDLNSKEFYSCKQGYKMRLQIRFHKDNCGVFLIFVPGANDAHLPAVFHHRKTLSILDRSNRNEKRHIIRVIEPHFRDGQPARWMQGYWGNLNFCSYSLLVTNYKDVYLKSDSIFLKVVVEPIFPLARSPFSNNGVLLWKVLNYTRTKQDSQARICVSYYSDSFYSSTSGYRMQCRLYFGESQLNIWLCFLEGEFDDLLPDIYAHKVTFSIMDQIDTSGYNKIDKVATLDPKVIGIKEAKIRMSASGCSGTSFPFSAFEKSRLYEHDSILIKVNVEHINNTGGKLEFRLLCETK